VSLAVGFAIFWVAAGETLSGDCFLAFVRVWLALWLVAEATGRQGWLQGNRDLWFWSDEVHGCGIYDVGD
jgi:hypothetical protein